MADRDRSSEESAADDRDKENQSGDPQRDENSEWLRDQTGEDHNLSGSSTYRTLPDQPDGDDAADDTRDRQSNR